MSACLDLGTQDASEEEREHAELLMEYQNKRGGRVQLQSIITPESEFNHAEKVGCRVFAFRTVTRNV